MKAFLLSLLLLPSPALADGPELSACEKIDVARDAAASCTDYDAHPGFRELKSVKEAKAACLGFFKAAWETNLFFCGFSRHVLDTRAAASRLAPGSAELTALGEKDRAFFAETVKGLAHHHGVIRARAQELRVKAGRVHTEGLDTAVAEMNCTFNRNRTPPGPVAGPMLQGLAIKANTEVWLNEPELISSLRATHKVIKAAQGENKQAPLPSINAQLLGDPKEPKKKEGRVEAPEPAQDPTPDSTHAFWALNSIAQYYTEHFGDEYLSIWAKKLFRRHPAIAKKLPWLAKKFPEYAGTIASAGIGVGLQYLAHGKVGALDLISVGVTAYSFGAGLFVDVVIAAYRDTQDRKREYGDFAQGELKKRPYMSSAVMATLWAKENKTTCWFREDKWAHLEAEGKKNAPAPVKKPEGEGTGEDEEEEEE
jgi:hypothetical protein